MRNLQLKSFIFGAVATVGSIFGIAWLSDSKLDAKDLKDLGAKNPPVVVSADVTALNQAFKDVASKVNPSVVSISVTVEQEIGMDGNMPELFRRFMGEDEGTFRSRGAGSGVIISEDGYIITNNHVVDDAVEGNGIQVILDDKRKFNAEVIGTDELTDLAIIKIDAEGLTPVHIGDIESVDVGQIVFAVGNPLGLSGTVTSGIISAISRGGIGARGANISNYIQTDAAINPGNSGGGLFDIYGSLVGINTAIASETGSYIGYGFAIPIDLVRAVAGDIIEDGKVDRGYIGVGIRTIEDPIQAKGMGLPDVSGVLVDKVYENSAGEKAGLKRWDVIIKVNRKKVASSNELQNIVALNRAGDNVELTIIRDKERITKTVTLKARDTSEDFADAFGFSEEDEKSSKENDKDDKTEISYDQLGLTVSNLTPEARKKYDIENGVLILDVERYSIASDKNGFRPGYIITEVDGKEIVDLSTLDKYLSNVKPGDIVKFITLAAYSDGEILDQMSFIEWPGAAN
ncbi:MAG: DegQ family serine endoprotease [Candidatus Kapaibacteriales bacterium]